MPKKRAPKRRAAKTARAEPVASKLTMTKLSTKGQLVIPAAIRNRLGWEEGEELFVEEVAGGIRLSGRNPFGPPLTVDDVFGIGRKFYKGPPVSLEEMDRRAREGFAKRYGREHEEPRRRKRP